MQSSCSLNLANNVIFPEQLEKPIVAFVLNNVDFADEFHVWIYSYPKHGVVVQFTTKENVFCFEREVLKFEFIHFKLLHVALY